jgi:carbonic anhydrase/acetyltransferase-like protein (isoleucine patch superfamily)
VAGLGAAVLHGCTIEDGVLVGVGALGSTARGARWFAEAAGAVVPQGMQIPPGSLPAGVPAKVRRELTEAGVPEHQGQRRYLLLAQAHSELFAEGSEADLD